MQNVDFYEGKTGNERMPQYTLQDSDIYTGMQQPRHYNANDKRRKRASRIIFLISSLCIISFTAGIGVGLKFAGGAERKIIDNNTYDAVSGLKNKMSTLMHKKDEPKKNTKATFPRSLFPYVIRITKKYDNEKTREIAQYLSDKGHTVILTKHDDSYRIYIGPFRSKASALISADKISSYKKYSLEKKARIIKR